MRYKISLAPAVPHHACSGFVRMFSGTIDDPRTRRGARCASPPRMHTAFSVKAALATEPCSPAAAIKRALRSGCASAVPQHANGETARLHVLPALAAPSRRCFTGPPHCASTDDSPLRSRASAEIGSRRLAAHWAGSGRDTLPSCPMQRWSATSAVCAAFRTRLHRHAPPADPCT